MTADPYIGYDDHLFYEISYKIFILTRHKGDSTRLIRKSVDHILQEYTELNDSVFS